MAYKGFIEPNVERIADLLRALMIILAKRKTRLALWILDEFDFSQIAATQSATQIIGSASPFPKSGSNLAGTGYLISVESNSVDELVDVLTGEDHLDACIMHLEIEVEGNIAVASYDHFSCLFFNEPIEQVFLEELKQQTIINDYGV